MIKKLRLIAVSLITIFSIVAFSSTAFAATDARQAVCEGAGIVASSNDCTGDANTPTVDNAISAAINILSSIVGIAGVIMVVVGGFKYITAGGDTNKVGAAKTTIIYALIGLVIAAMAQVLVHYVLFKATNADRAPTISCTGSTAGFTDPACVGK
jgi:hypothetical protein